MTTRSRKKRDVYQGDHGTTFTAIARRMDPERYLTRINEDPTKLFWLTPDELANLKQIRRS